MVQWYLGVGVWEADPRSKHFFQDITYFLFGWTMIWPSFLTKRLLLTVRIWSKTTCHFSFWNVVVTLVGLCLVAEIIGVMMTVLICLFNSLGEMYTQWWVFLLPCLHSFIPAGWSFYLFGNSAFIYQLRNFQYELFLFSRIWYCLNRYSNIITM